MLNEEFLKTAKPINMVINEHIAFNLALQVSGGSFVERGGVAVPYLLSAPGAGKTSMIKDLCMRLGWILIILHAAMKPQEEFGGIPEFEVVEIGGQKFKGTIWSLPDLISQIYKAAEMNVDNVVVMFDDMHLCGSTHLGLMQELFSERSIRGYDLPDKCSLIAAGNTTNKAGARNMSSAITNRMCMLNVVPDFEYWKLNFAIGTNTDKLKLPFDSKQLMEVGSRISSVHPGIVSFLEQDIYRQYWNETEQIDVAWGSTRSWTRFSNWLYAYELVHNSIMPEQHALYLGTGHVGKDGASEFAKYYRIFSKFDIPHIIDNADTFSLPSSPVDRYALVYALVNYFSNHKTRKEVAHPFAKVVLKYYDDHKDMALIIMQNIIDIEKRLKKRDLYGTLSAALNNLRKDVTYDLIQEISNV